MAGGHSLAVACRAVLWSLLVINRRNRSAFRNRDQFKGFLASSLQSLPYYIWINFGISSGQSYCTIVDNSLKPDSSILTNSERNYQPTKLFLTIEPLVYTSIVTLPSPINAMKDGLIPEDGTLHLSAL